jgi:peptidoglycan/LPS O-acetylase OafA/YrhL
LGILIFDAAFILTVQPAFILALRAFAAVVIVWHHFSLYAPLRDWAEPLIGGALSWLSEHGRSTQIFFVVSGYVLAQSMRGREWGLAQLGRFAIQRYCRLGLPYLAIVILILPIYELARGWVPDEVLGQPVSVAQFLAHLFFLQDILGYEALSAGLWFVCVNFQLGLLYAVSLILQRRFGAGDDEVVMLVGWALSLYSLFYFNLDPAGACWALYFFPFFFMGVLANKALTRGGVAGFLIFQGVMMLALFYAWRWRLAVTMIFGLLLFIAGRAGVGKRWSTSGLVARIGRLSFSLFLIHFPVLVVVGALWSRFGWHSPAAATAGLLVAFGGSLVAAHFFYRWVESPAARLAKRFRAPEKARQPDGEDGEGRRLAFEH